MGFRRGFETEANGIAKAIREELGLAPLDALDPRKLAELIEIPILPLSSRCDPSFPHGTDTPEHSMARTTDEARRRRTRGGSLTRPDDSRQDARVRLVVDSSNVQIWFSTAIWAGVL